MRQYLVVTTLGREKGNCREEADYINISLLLVDGAMKSMTTILWHEVLRHLVVEGPAAAALLHI